MSSASAIKIAVTAMGGQGGGVLAGWIAKLGEENGFIAQSTSVPGVAQRTGATIYYVELFPQAAAQAANKHPILSLMPTPGDVDIVVAAELMEAGRAILRGFVSPQTTLIASSHRDYAISEKSGMGDTRQEAEGILNAAKESAGVFIVGDMARSAAEAGTVISAVLFGALAGSGALPVERERFEAQIKNMGRAVESNLRGFEFGWAIAQQRTEAGEDSSQAPSGAASASDSAPSPDVAPLIARMRQEFPPSAHFYIFEGLKRTTDFQDVRYAQTYLDRLARVLEQDRAKGGADRDWRLTQTVAKHLALWMTYEDTIRVADLKTRAPRFDRFREDVRAAPDQIVQVSEFLHPRVEEICDILPTSVAKWILHSDTIRSVLTRLLGDGRRVSTTKLRGYLPLFAVASMRGMRRWTYRYALETERISSWLSDVEAAVQTDYALAVEVARLQRLIKGYGDTHERGLRNFALIRERLAKLSNQPEAAKQLAKLHEAALRDEDGNALTAALGALDAPEEKAA